MRLVSIGTLVVALFTLGLILLVRSAAIGLGRSVKENISLTVELTGDDARAQFAYLKEQVAGLPSVKAVEYIDAEQAAREVAERLGENPVDVLGYNPLSSVARLSIHADYMQPDSLARLQQRLSLSGIDAQLDYRGDLLEAVEANTAALEWVLWVLLVLQSVFAFIQINNTTRLMIYADRLKVRTLCLVGASPWFIRRPIIGRSMLDAFVAAVLSLLLLYGTVVGAERALSATLHELLPAEYLLMDAVVLIGVAFLSSFVASALASQKYVRMDGGKIHLI